MARSKRLLALAPLILLAVAAIYALTRSGAPPFEELRGHNRPVSVIDWSSDGRFIASGSYDQTVRLWDAASGNEIMSLPGISGAVMSLAFSSDSQLLAAGAHDYRLHVWEIPSGREIPFPQVHKGYITGIAFSSDGTQIATGSHEKLVVLWDLKKKIPLRKLWGFKHWVGAVAFSPDSRTLAIGDAASVRLVNVNSAVESARIPSDPVHWISFSPDGRSLAVGSAYGKSQVYDVTTLAPRFSLAAHTGASGVYRRDGTAIATGGGNELVIWDGRTGKQKVMLASASGAHWPRWLLRILPVLKPPQPIPIHEIAYSPDGSGIAAACPDSLIRVWRNLPK
jgi:WD40 repeat protein